MEKLSDLQRAQNAESPKKRWVEPVTALLNGPGPLAPLAVVFVRL
jgi:hypothetical protein